MQTSLFPHDNIRAEQDKLIDGVLRTIDASGKLVVHAPTGLGKTAATLAPAIERAIHLNKVVIFMTSRLTQHALALQTVTRIRQKHHVEIPVVDLIGKKHFCLQPGVDNLAGKEFAEYCKNMREEKLCEYYERLSTGEQQSAAERDVLIQLGKTAPNTPEQVKMLCAQEDNKLCPYEITMEMAKDARIIISDYSYIFNEKIRDTFFRRINKELKDCILIVDEGHNLPNRVKDLASEKITSLTVRRAINELIKINKDDHKHHLQQLGEILDSMGMNLSGADEQYVSKQEFIDAVSKICALDVLADDLENAARIIREDQKVSSCGAIADFLSAWSGEDFGFTRIISRSDKIMKEEESQTEQKVQATFSWVDSLDKKTPDKKISKNNRGVDGAENINYRNTDHGRNDSDYVKRYNFMLSYRCLDPSVITKPIFDSAYSAIVMSGTLTPPLMYAQLLGIDDAEQMILFSPFPNENRMNIIIPKTTTKFTNRSPQMYAEIGSICSSVINLVPGNIAVFFPSYQILSDVKITIDRLSEKTMFYEHQSFTKEERDELLAKFKGYKRSGAALLGVMGGSFSEGIDLPGDELRCVVVVGLPLGRPDLETKALIDYYQNKFGKGWEYGYTYPAFNKTLQSAGRCIRTETDRGAIVFVDERYAWKSYYDCFPKDWSLAVTIKYEKLLRSFFNLPNNDQ